MKMPGPLTENLAYQVVTRGLLRMHQYTIKGQNESEEADALREAMDEPWQQLSSTERKRVAGPSKDLYTVSDPPLSQLPESVNPQPQVGRREAYEALARQDWDRALELLR